MFAILNLLRDPEWWFTAVFVSIVASLAASYVRDAVSWLLSFSSTVVRKRRSERMAMAEERVRFLAAHPAALAMETTRAWSLVLALGLMACLFLLTQILVTQLRDHDISWVSELLIDVGNLALLATVISVDYRLTQLMAITREARRRYFKSLKSEMAIGTGVPDAEASEHQAP